MDHDGADFEFDRRGVRAAYEDYFELAARLAGSGTVDALAHVDVVKKHGRRLAEPIGDLYRPVVAAAAASGTAVEVSSAGLHAGAAEPYPAPDFESDDKSSGVRNSTSAPARPAIAWTRD